MLSILLAMLQAGAAQDPAREVQMVTAGETARVAEARRMPASAIGALRRSGQAVCLHSGCRMLGRMMWYAWPGRWSRTHSCSWRFAGASAPTQNSQSLGMGNAQAAPQLASKQLAGDIGRSAGNGTSASAGPCTGTNTTGTAQPLPHRLGLPVQQGAQRAPQHAKRAQHARQPSPGLGGTVPVRMLALFLNPPSSTHLLHGPQPPAPPPPPPPLRPMHQQPAAMQTPTVGMAGTGKPSAPFGAVGGPWSSAPAAPAPGPESSAPAAPARSPGSSAPAAPAPGAPAGASTVLRPMPSIASYQAQRAYVSVMISSAGGRS